MIKRAHKNLRTTVAMRRAIQHSSASIRSLAQRYGINPKTVSKWRQRTSAADLKTGPREPKSSVLTIAEEACIVAFRRHVVLPLNDCLHALQSAIPHLTRSSLHRCLQRHDISRQPELPAELPHRNSHAGHFIMGIIELTTKQRVLQVFVAIERTSKFAFVELRAGNASKAAGDFLRALVKSAPCKIRSLVTQGGPFGSSTFNQICAINNIEHQQSSQDYLWSDTQRQHIDRTIKKAIEERRSENVASDLGKTLAKFVVNYNVNCRLKTLKGQTPSECMEQLEAGLTGRSTQSRDSLAGLQHAAAARTAVRKKPLIRDPGNTREAILKAARTCLAHDGPEGLSLAEVARIAGVNRGTAYQHFKSREKLIAETAKWVSNKLFRAVFGEPQEVAKRPVGQADVAELIDRLANFAMDNPELCRAWLLQVLSSPNPSSDQFWKQYAGSTERLATTELAQDNVDAEVLSVIMLAGAFLWPVWARAHANSRENLRPLAHRFAQECLRISMYGNLRIEHYPAIAKRLSAYRSNRSRPSLTDA